MTTDPQSFDHLPAWYDRFAQLSGGALGDRLSSLLPPEGGDRAFDLGCGTGRHALPLADRYGDVLAVDISAPMVEFARTHRARPNIRYQHRDLLDVHPDTDGQADLVLCAYTLHHITDLDAALTRCRALAAPGGMVILVENVADPGLADLTGRLPRWYYMFEAERGYDRDLAVGRDPDEAAELRLLKYNREWLDHQTADRLPTPEEYTRRFLGVFLGAEVTELHRARILRWVKPA